MTTATHPSPTPPIRHIDVVKANAIIAHARALIGIHEIPDGSNTGPDVHTIQSATGAYNAPWCVSTGQYIALHALGHTFADDTANAYYAAQYAQDHGWVVPHAIPGCFVVYHIGAGHFGTVVKLNPDGSGSFDAVEGNEGNAVRTVHRDPRTITCTFFVLPDLWDSDPGKIVDGVRYYTFRKDVPLTGKQIINFTTGKGYYAGEPK